MSADLVTVRELPPRGMRAPDARGWVDLLVPTAELARTVENTDFVPKAMRNNVPAVTAAILYGDEVGLGPMVSLANIRVIEGVPNLSAKAQRALVLAAGHDIWPEESTTMRATWCGRRQGRDEVVRVTWSLDDAKSANLLGKDNWKRYPRQMLSARASAELVGALFPDVVGGLYAIEEFEGTPLDATADAEPAAGVSPPARKRTRRREGVAAAVPAAPSATQDPPTPPRPLLPGDVPLMNDAQRKKLQALARDKRVGNRQARLALASKVAGRKLATTSELTVGEASRVIDYLVGLPSPAGDNAPSSPEPQAAAPDDARAGDTESPDQPEAQP